MFAKKEGLKEAITLVNHNLNACSQLTGLLGLKLCIDQKENEEGSLHVKTPSVRYIDYIRRLIYMGKDNNSYQFSLAFRDRNLNLFVSNSYVKATVSMRNNMERRTLDVIFYIDATGKVIGEDYKASSCYGIKNDSWEYINTSNDMKLAVDDHIKGFKLAYCSKMGKEDTLLGITIANGESTTERITIGKSMNDYCFHTRVNDQETILPHSVVDAKVIASSLLASEEVQSIKNEVLGAFSEFIAYPELIFNSNALLANNPTALQSNDSLLSSECDTMKNELTNMFKRVYSSKMKSTTQSA